MRGADTFTESAFTLHRLEDFVPPNHPLRPIRQMVNEALVLMNDVFAGMYEADAKGGRPSIAPEKLLRAMLLAKCSTAQLGTPAYGAGAVQPALPLVYRLGYE